MATYKVRPSNGVSYGLKYAITASDASAGNIIFDFRKGTSPFRYDLVATVDILNGTTGAYANPGDLLITYPVKGQVKIAGTLISTTVVNLIAQEAKPTV
jgi:hypothetical protein